MSDKFDIKSIHGIVKISSEEIQRARDDATVFAEQVLKANDQFNKDIIKSCREHLFMRRRMSAEEIKELFGNVPDEYEKALNEIPETEKNALLYGEWGSPEEGESHD